MIRYLLSSPQFTGSAILAYAEGMLATIDVLGTDMRAEHRIWLFANTPVLEADLQRLAASFKEATIVQEHYEPSLEDFKREYPYQRNMHLLPEVWKRMDSLERVKAWLAAKEYRRYCDRNDKWYQAKIAAAWLKQKEYLNDWKKL